MGQWEEWEQGVSVHGGEFVYDEMVHVHISNEFSKLHINMNIYTLAFRNM